MLLIAIAPPISVAFGPKRLPTTLPTRLLLGDTPLSPPVKCGLPIGASTPPCARAGGQGGHADGVERTVEKLDLAHLNAHKSGCSNATFLKGTIENVPLPDASIDVVISNCVINLAADKGAVIKEAFRVLRPGGLFAVADMVELDALDPTVKKSLDSWAGCISGTITIEDYRKALIEAGFQDTDFQVHATQSIPGSDGKVGSAYIRAKKPT